MASDFDRELQKIEQRMKQGTVEIGTLKSYLKALENIAKLDQKVGAVLGLKVSSDGMMDGGFFYKKEIEKTAKILKQKEAEITPLRDYKKSLELALKKREAVENDGSKSGGSEGSKVGSGNESI